MLKQYFFIFAFALLLAALSACSEPEVMVTSTITIMATAMPEPTQTPGLTSTPTPLPTAEPTEISESENELFLTEDYWHNGEEGEAAYLAVSRFHMAINDPVTITVPFQEGFITVTNNVAGFDEEDTLVHLCGIHHWKDHDDITTQHWHYALVVNTRPGYPGIGCFDINKMYWGDQYDSDSFEKVWSPWVALTVGIVVD